MLYKPHIGKDLNCKIAVVLSPLLRIINVIDDTNVQVISTINQICKFHDST